MPYNHKFPQNVSGCLLSFPVSNFREASYTCDTPKQLVDASESLSNTLLDWGFGQSASNRAALCVEEYGMLLMSKSFHETDSQRKQNSFTIRAAELKDRVLLKIQDTYPVLNSMEWMKAHQSYEDISGDSLGIRLIFASADGIEYRNILGLNTILITMKAGKRINVTRPSPV